MAQSATTPQRQAHYAVPSPMPWPIMGAAALFLMAVGAVFLFNGRHGGWVSIGAGFLLLLYMMVRWFGDVIRESEGGKYGRWDDVSFRWGMSWFIFSEVMFFGAFFGALFYVRNMSVPDLGGLDAKLLWPDYIPAWPTNGPYSKDPFTPMSAIGIPLLNTIILVSSGGTLTIAHHALKEGRRDALKLWLFLTIVLGFTFLGFQAYEYTHAYSELNLKLSTGVYGSTFFMLTGFHGFHVTIGAIMLSVMLVRAFRGRSEE